MPKVRTRQSLSSSSGSSSTAVTTPRPQALVAPPPQAVAPPLETPIKFISYTFLVVPEGARWLPIGEPTITHWLAHPKLVVGSLLKTKRWVRMNYPTSFPKIASNGMLRRFLGDCPNIKIWNIHIRMS